MSIDLSVGVSIRFSRDPAQRGCCLGVAKEEARADVGLAIKQTDAGTQAKRHGGGRRAGGPHHSGMCALLVHRPPPAPSTLHQVAVHIHVEVAPTPTAPTVLTTPADPSADVDATTAPAVVPTDNAPAPVPPAEAPLEAAVMAGVWELDPRIRYGHPSQGPEVVVAGNTPSCALFLPGTMCRRVGSSAARGAKARCSSAPCTAWTRPSRPRTWLQYVWLVDG